MEFSESKRYYENYLDVPSMFKDKIANLNLACETLKSKEDLKGNYLELHSPRVNHKKHWLNLKFKRNHSESGRLFNSCFPIFSTKSEVFYQEQLSHIFFLKKDFRKSLIYLLNSLKVSKNCSESSFMNYYLQLKIGVVFFEFLGNFIEGIGYLNLNFEEEGKIFNLIPQDSRALFLLTSTYLWKGIGFFNLGDFTKALNLFEKAKKFGCSELYPEIESEIGKCLRRLKKKEESIKCYLHLVEYLKSEKPTRNNKKKLCVALKNSGINYELWGLYDQAETNLKESIRLSKKYYRQDILDIYKKLESYDEVLYYSYGSLSTIYSKKKLFDKSTHLRKKSLKFGKRNFGKDNDKIFWNYKFYAENLFQNRQLEKANQKIGKSIKGMQKIYPLSHFKMIQLIELKEEINKNNA